MKFTQKYIEIHWFTYVKRAMVWPQGWVSGHIFQRIWPSAPGAIISKSLEQTLNQNRADRAGNGNIPWYCSRWYCGYCLKTNTSWNVWEKVMEVYEIYLNPDRMLVPMEIRHLRHRKKKTPFWFSRLQTREAMAVPNGALFKNRLGVFSLERSPSILRGDTHVFHHGYPLVNIQKTMENHNF